MRNINRNYLIEHNIYGEMELLYEHFPKEKSLSKMDRETESPLYDSRRLCTKSLKCLDNKEPEIRISCAQNKKYIRRKGHK